MWQDQCGSCGTLFQELTYSGYMSGIYIKPAFLKLWSTDHKCSSGSALTVLLD